MTSRNAIKDFAKKTALYKKKYKAFFNDFCDKNYQMLIGAIAERTPVDFGVLREGWSRHSAMENQGEKIIFHIYNPADYAAHVEYGYHQKPGMILQMEMRMGRLRFVKYLGHTFKVGSGDPTGKAEPDDNGLYTIVTRKRYIPGHHMLKDSVDEFKKELPKRYEQAFSAFNRRNG
jgi:hypothetical protein